MIAAGSERAELKPIEFALTAGVVLLKLNVLRSTWGRVQGFDALAWLEVFQGTHWFHELPGVRTFWNSYHPPLSYLICRWIYAAYPHEVQDSQILSTLAIIVSLFAIRSTLRTIGILWTLPGLALLYVAASIPLVVWMAVETSYDALVLMWMTLALAISVRLFWRPIPAAWWRNLRYVGGLVLLALVIAAGLLTKFNTTVALGIPWLVIACRRGPRRLLREWSAPLSGVLLAVLLAAPLYYDKYFRPLGQIFPQNIEWLRADDLRAALASRDADPWGFVRHMIRIPEEPIVGTQDPVVDSAVHSLWLQIWKRDSALGEQARPSLAVSDFYVRVFPVIVAGSTLLFLVRRRRMPRAWRHLGYVLLTVAVTYCVLLLYFGWKYPIWDWRIFKAKYITPAVLWIPYCVALPFVGRSGGPQISVRSLASLEPADPQVSVRSLASLEPADPQVSVRSLASLEPADGSSQRRWWRRTAGDAVAAVAVIYALAVVLFVLINHLLPVY
jgi:hypothetical protein